MSQGIKAAAERLQLHPYLYALGYSVLCSLTQDCISGPEKTAIYEAWLLACSRYGLDQPSRTELLKQISEEEPS